MIAGLILAAGASRRMGTPKALLTIDDRTFLDRLVRTAAGVCDPVLVVLGHHADAIRRTIDASFVINPDPERGMLSSLQCGLEALPPETEAVIFTPVDYPAVAAGTYVKLAEEFRSHPCDVILPRYQGMKGHPVCISRNAVRELRQAAPAARANNILARFLATTRYIEVDDPAILSDIDTPADYQKLLAGQPA